MLIITLIVLAVYFFCPTYLKFVLLLVNLYVPDAIPVVDEVLMTAGLIGDFCR